MKSIKLSGSVDSVSDEVRDIHAACIQAKVRILPARERAHMDPRNPSGRVLLMEDLFDLALELEEELEQRLQEGRSRETILQQMSHLIMAIGSELEESRSDLKVYLMFDSNNI